MRSGLTSSRSQVSLHEETLGHYNLIACMCSNGQFGGDVISLTRIRTPVYGDKYSTEFWLNKYETKEIFWALYTL
jgi:hypothetical protein